MSKKPSEQELQKLLENANALAESISNYEKSEKVAKRVALLEVLKNAKKLLITSDSISIISNLENKLQEEYSQIEQGEAQDLTYVKFLSKAPISTILKSMQQALTGDFLNDFNNSMQTNIIPKFENDFESLVFMLNFIENELLNTECK
jgi:hypothetical protein